MPGCSVSTVPPNYLNTDFYSLDKQNHWENVFVEPRPQIKTKYLLLNQTYYHKSSLKQMTGL